MNVVREVLQTVGSGGSVLCSGPPLAGKRDFLARLLEQAAADGHTVLFVTTDEDAAGLLRSYPDAFSGGRAGIVDCTGTPTPDGDRIVETVGSPSDLTGIAVAVSKARRKLEEDGQRVVVALDSLTTLCIYSDFDRVFRFVHSFVQQVRGGGGLLAMSLDDDSIDSEERGQLSSIAAQRVEFRNATEYRLVDQSGTQSEWSRFDANDVAVDDRTSIGTDEPSEPPRPGSLAALIAQVREDRPTLTLGNPPDGVDVDPLVDRAERLALSVDHVAFNGGRPVGVGLLHDGETLLAAGAVADAVEALVDPFADDGTMDSPLLDALPHDVFAADSCDRARLLRVSRTVERLALRRGAGTLHAGFQLFSRLTREPDTVAVYERLLEEGVEVHLYGELDADLPVSLDGAIVRGVPADEVGDTWFLVFDGDGEFDDGGTLVTRETAPNRYDGFWSYERQFVERTLDYLETEYGAVER